MRRSSLVLALVLSFVLAPHAAIALPATTPGSIFPVDFDTADYHTCIVMSNGDVDCYGSALHGKTEDRRRGDAVDVGTGQSQTCILLANGDVTCRGYGDARITGHSGGGGVSLDGTCVLLSNGNVDCWGLNGGWCSQCDYTGGDAVDIATGGYNCVLTTGRLVKCWGHGIGGTPVVKDATGLVVDFAVGSDGLCVVYDNGNGACYPDGRDDRGWSAPHTAGLAKSVALGYYHACWLLVTGNVDCQGWNNGGNTADYLGGDAVMVRAGGWHSCAMVQNATLQCWGDNAQGQSIDWRDNDRDGIGDIEDLDDDNDHLADELDPDADGDVVPDCAEIVDANEAQACLAAKPGGLQPYAERCSRDPLACAGDLQAWIDLLSPL